MKIKLLTLGLASILIVALAIMVSTSTTSTINSQIITNKTTSANKVISSQKPLIYNGVNQQQLQSCIKAGGNCIKTVPGLNACMQAGLNCNDLVQNKLSNPVTSGVPLISKAKALSMIDNSHSGIKSTSANLTTYGHIHKTWPALAASAIVNPSRPVWVVKMKFLTPHYSKGSFPPPGAKTPKISGYVEVIDAATGTVMDTGTL